MNYIILNTIIAIAAAHGSMDITAVPLNSVTATKGWQMTNMFMRASSTVLEIHTHVGFTGGNWT